MPTIDEWMDDGNGALAIGELDEAAKCFREVVTQDPQCQDGWHALSMAATMPESDVTRIIGISQRVISTVTAKRSCGKCTMSGT